MAVKTENKPITITLGNLLKIFTDETTSNNTSEDQALLGKDACTFLYGDITEGSPSINRIRNCCDQQQKNTYSQSYNGYSRIADRYFPDMTAANYKGDAKKVQEEIRVLRDYIFNAWQKRFDLYPRSDYDTEIEKYLSDASLKNSEVPGVKEIRDFLLSYNKAVQSTDRADVYTVLTILSITRTYWSRLPSSIILPVNYKNKARLISTSDIEVRYQDAQEFYEEGQYDAALNKLENLVQSNTAVFNKSQKAFYRFNSKVCLLRSQVRRQIMQDLDSTSNEYAEMKMYVRDDLYEAIDNHSTEAMLIVARECYGDRSDSVFDKDLDECLKLCKKVFDEYPDSDECGEAAWILYQENYEGNADVYLKVSYECSYEAAIKEYKIINTVSLTNTIEQSTDTSTGYYYINDKNPCSEMIEESAPRGWQLNPYPLEKASYYRNTADLRIKLTTCRKKQRFFLISDDFDRNLQELLLILQTIKSSQAINTGSYPKNHNISYEFYIRGNEEKIAPFVDTALARIKNLIIPVHIIDEDKMAARVLAQHPLFYSIRRLSETGAAHLKFLVVGNTKVCDWLVREASWMLTFRNPKIESEILIIAPDADSVKERIEYRCPDIENSSLDISIKKADYETPKFLEAVSKALSSGYPYFAIDTGSDIDNMELAVKIRECCIRKKIKDDADNISESPVITFYCQDPDIANLSLNTIVINEDAGKKWYNNYRVIPFGRRDRLYHWDNITNHILEQLSLNIHLQYYLNDSPSMGYSLTKSREDYYTALIDYYGRTYNRDSSMAVAMSLPYRLYQGIVDKTRLLPSERINIMDDEAFYSVEARNKYSVLVKKINWENSEYIHEFEQRHSDSYGKDKFSTETEFDPKSEVYQMAKWEQKRWNQFMRSRGWINASIRQMRMYYGKGNANQQLYIGKMHPCIEDYPKLESISNKYNELSGKDKEFQMSNITSIQRTEKILSLYWAEKAKSMFEKQDDENQKS